MSDMTTRPDLDGMEHVLDTCKPKLDGSDSKPVLREHVIGTRKYCRQLLTYCRELEEENKRLRRGPHNVGAPSNNTFSVESGS